MSSKLFAGEAMRSTFFVILSLLVHALCVMAIAVSPRQVAAPEGEAIEVQMGEPADKAGLETAPEGVSQAAAPVLVAKADTRKTQVTKAPMEKVSEFKRPTKAAKVVEDPSEALDPQIEPVAPVSTAATQPELIPVKESVSGVEASDEEAGPSEEQGEPSTPVGRGQENQEDAELAKGGATKAGAVSYLDLKQQQGNRAPLYPINARKEARQGQVELVYRVTKEGRVADLQVAKSSGFADLDQEAARAVAQFKFVPGQEGWARHPVSFNLKGQTAQLPSKLRSANAN